MFVDACRECRREYGYRAVGGDGPQPARVLIVMERPGQDENRNGRVACGATGQELDELYLPLAGLDRSEVRVCNTVLCGNATNRKPTDKEIAQCAPFHLPDEIEKTNPDVILLLGATPCSLVEGIRLDMMHGIPQHTSKVGALLGWEGWLVPMYHPAIGMHESRYMTICMEDWAALKGAEFKDDPPVEEHDYQITDGNVLRNQTLHPRCRSIALDTESMGGKPWSVQFSAAKGVGYLVPASDKRALCHLQRLLAEVEEIVMHNAAYDLEVLRHLGIHVRRFRDTMQEAFQLGNLPHGLKPLTYRLFRHTMTSYEETVRPASLRKLIEWLTEALCIAQQDFTLVTERFGKTGKRLKDESRKGEMESLLKRLLQKTDPYSEYDPYGKPDDPRLAAFWSDPMNEWQTSHVEGRIGRYPIIGIANCAMDEAIQYAVGDADWTGQVAVELARRRKGAFQIFEGDRDV